MEIKEALEKGILKDKVVYLRLIPKSNALTNDPQHVAYGGFDGSIKELTIGVDKYGAYVNPFEGEKGKYTPEEEQKFFETITKRDLSVYSPKNEYWENYVFKVVKDPSSIKVGIKFDLSNPRQMLDYKVLLTNKKIVCSDMSIFKNNPNPFFDYVFVDEDYEEIKASVEMDENKKIYMFFGKIEDSPTKMREFLNVYYTTNMKSNQVSEAMSKEALHQEISKIIREDRKGYIAIMEDANFDIKVFIGKAIEAGAITKEGFSYRITGESRDFSYDELVAFIKMIKADKDLLYGKIDAQIKGKK